MLIHIVHLVNFGQSLSKSHIVQSMLNFTMFLANSDKETVRTIRFDPYCQYKIFIKFHQRLILFSISNAFKKLNWRQHNVTHIVLKIVIFFRSALHFLIFLVNFGQKTIRLDPCYPCFKDSIKKNFFFLFQIFIKQESRTERFVPYFPFNTLNKFLTNSPIFFCFKYFQEIWVRNNTVWPVWSFQ